MKLQVFSVFDKAVGAFLQPFFSRSKGDALRSFADACNEKDHNFNKHALDFVLMYLGEFDDNSGRFIDVEPTRVLGAFECVVDSAAGGRAEANGAGRNLPM